MLQPLLLLLLALTPAAAVAAAPALAANDRAYDLVVRPTPAPVLTANDRAYDLVVRPSPAPVLAAIDRAYEVGRDQRDLGGILAVRAFAVRGEAPDLGAVVALALEAAATDPRNAVAAFCADRFDGAPPDRACADELVRAGSRQRALPFAASLGLGADGELLDAYVVGELGEDYWEFGAHVDLFGVDAATAILVDRSLRRVVVLHYDAGS